MTYSLANLPKPANDNFEPWSDDALVAFWFGGQEAF